ncbi:Pre-mRNA-splicing factor Cwf15/Cwc15 [Apiosordaria backusii]|uniref:Pre-mRNA-splicing factor Cwf15/Cwc15 n=1 Tax=Apiosordaria backusii TaxID=314023 RepID=A0AA40BMJ1_9PEZI|nr:Pre-mRNA-splicing factor Cwf15/Cwc15 [Apiosordaria backusii]
MTTAHRPTFDPARGKEALRGPAYHQRLLPAYTQLKFRQPGQGGDADSQSRDLRAELEAAEAAHYAKLKGAPIPGQSQPDQQQQSLPNSSSKRPLEITGNPSSSEEEDPESKRRRILEETRAIDADDSDASSEEDDEEDDDDDDNSDSDSDSDDEEAELQRELERVRRERAEKREREEKERLAAEEAERERDIALGNPLLNNNNNNNSSSRTDFNIKRRWDDDVVFKNQARGTEEKGKKKEFINDLLRSDFHKRFMSKYVR